MALISYAFVRSIYIKLQIRKNINEKLQLDENIIFKDSSEG